MPPLAMTYCMSEQSSGYNSCVTHLEGIIHLAAVASLVAVAGRAVDEVLLRERDEVASGNSMGALDRASRGERPARAALALVLNGGHHALGAPVHGGRNGEAGEVGIAIDLAGVAEEVVHLAGKLADGEVT